MVKTPTSLLPIFGSAVAVSLMVLVYYEIRRHVTGENEAKCYRKETANTDKTDPDDYNTKTSKKDLEEYDQIEHEYDVIEDVTACSSRTSFTSFDDDEMKSCHATSSSTSAYSTASDDNGPFPVGEYSTYKQQKITNDLQNLDLHEILNSPVVENHCMDERMRRSPTEHNATLEKYYTSTDASKPCEVESTNLKSIVVAYNDIVPPLKPNTGEIIHPSNIAKYR